MNATNFGTNKDFRKTVDIRQKVRHGKIERKIYLPPEEFAYGLPNRPPTPFKDVIYNAYGNRAEDIIRNEYDNYIRERSVKDNRPPQVITRYINPKAEEYKKRDLERKTGGLTGYNEFENNDNPYETKNEKPLYKLKMFQDVGSKVAEEVKLFKTQILLRYWLWLNLDFIWIINIIIRIHRLLKILFIIFINFSLNFIN